MALGIDVLKQYIGLDENVNVVDIMLFLKEHAVKGDITINPSRLAWCAATVNACERCVGNKGTGSLMARSFLKYGTKVELTDIKRGDICVFDFEHDGIHGHVTYFDKLVKTEQGKELLQCLGGNQDNKVKYSLYHPESLAGIRRSHD